MASFKQIKDTQRVDDKYSGRVIVYLESEEDFQIFQELREKKKIDKELTDLVNSFKEA